MDFSETSSNTTILNALFVKDSVSNTPLRNGQCTKDKCIKSIERRLPPIHQPKPKHEEIWNVKALPTNCVPISKPSTVIENLFKKKQAQHEATINQIKTQFNTINLDIEAQIRLNSEMLKRDFEEIENEKQKCLENVDIEEMLELEKQNFETVTKTALDLHNKRVTRIENFYTFLQELEKLRANKFKIVLKSAYEKLHKIAYKLPYELQQYFEHEILQINQVLLSNFRCYADLQLRLNLQAEDTNRLFLRKLDTVKTKWREIRKRDALNKLNEQQLISPDCEALLLKTEQGQNVNSLFVAQEHSLEEMWTRLSPLPITSQEVNVWSRLMQDTINGLDTCARKLIEMYRTAVVTVFNGYFDELQNLTENMLEMGLVDSPEISAISLDFCQPTIESITRHYSDGLINLELLWDAIIGDLQTKLQNNYVFLHGVGHLWDNHYQRLTEAKRIVLKDLKKVIEKNNKATQDHEVKLNIILDQLRQAPSEEKLEDALDDASTLLAVIQKAYLSHYAGEVKIVGKYESIVETEADALLAELKQFLHIHPKVTENDPTLQKPRESQCNLQNNRPMILPQQMKQCEFQVAAVENWMFGLWEAIEKYINTCKEESIQQAQVWISERIKKLEKRLEVKLAYHTSRFSRIKININDIRLAELKAHSGRVARHKAGAEQSIEDIKQFYYIYENEYTKIIENYYKKTESIQSKMKTAKSSVTIKSYIAELNFNSNSSKQKINDLIQEQDTKYNLVLYKIRKTAADFSKQMKLFIEEGNFHYDEAKKMTKELKSFEKTIKKKYNAVKKEIQTKEKKMFAQIQKKEAESFQSLYSSLEEFEFNDKASNRIKKLQTEIRTEVYNIKLLHKQLENSFNEIEAKSLACLGDVTNLEEFLGEFNDFTLAMMEMSRFLYQQSPPINTSIKDLAELPRKSQQQVKSVNFENLLFPIKPTENEYFMSKICCYLQKSFKLIQSEAEEFYNKHGVIKNEGKVQPSFNEFMKEVLAKYNFYHLQCELLWLERVNEFLKMIQRLQKFSRGYRTDFLQQHLKIHMETLLGKHTEIIVELTNIKENNKKILHNLYDRLKPLYGCKRNKPLLEDLKQEMAEAVEEIRSFDIQLIIEPYKTMSHIESIGYIIQGSGFKEALSVIYAPNSEDKMLNGHAYARAVRGHSLLHLALAIIILRNIDINEDLGETLRTSIENENQEQHIIVYEEELHEASEKLEMLYNASYVELLNSRLIQQFEQKLIYMIDLLAQDLPESVETGVLAIYYENMRSWKIPSEYEINLKNTQALHYQDVITDPSNCDDKESVHSFECLEKFNEEHIQCLGAVEDIERDWNVDVDDYEVKFEDSIQKILKLYVVKYDNLPTQ